MRLATMFAAVLATAALLPTILPAAEPPVFTDRAGLAIRGFDPVAYFEEGKAVPGLEEFSFRWRDAEWRFASEASRDAFAGSPERYAPQYGGFCAYAMSFGSRAPIDPEAWDIVEGRLFLNKSRGVRKDWLEDRDGNIERADGHWAHLAEDE